MSPRHQRVILEKIVELGQIISSGTASVTGGTKIATMAELSSVYIKPMLTNRHRPVKLGLMAGIIVDAYNKEKFTGTVIKVEPKAIVEQSVTSFLVTTRIDNPQGLLKPG
jgi:HlyD family secretion protein